MLRKWSTLVLLLLATPMLALGQNTGKLAGRVLDAQTGEPLPGANVVLEGTQIGTITDVDGNYFIIGVPVGTYDVQSSFVGFQPVTVTDVEINNNSTRELNFSLAPGVELNEIVVEYERPLIQKDAIGVPSVITSEQIENLPVRGVANIAGLQAGVVKDEDSSTLNVRGGRGNEVVYYVDGVKIVGDLGVPQQAIQEQEMLIGSISARYGDAMSGIISVTTKAGAQKWFGSAEAVTSQVLDSYGYNLLEFSVGGPLVANRLSFFASGSLNAQEDNRPYSIDLPQLPGDLLNEITTNPQVLRIVNPSSGETGFLPFPSQLPDSVTYSEMVKALNIPAGFQLTSITPFARAETITREDLEFGSSKGNDDFRAGSFTGRLSADVLKNLTLSLGGQYFQSRDESWGFRQSLYINRPLMQVDEETYRFYGSITHRLSPATFYQVTGSYTSDYEVGYNPNFSDNVADALQYGDIDNPANAAASLYRLPVIQAGDTLFVRQYADGSLPQTAYNTFGLPGSPLGGYYKDKDEQLYFAANATTQLGLHQIEFGGEFEQRTSRYFGFTNSRGISQAYSLAQLQRDGRIEGDRSQAVDSYDQLSFKTMDNKVFYYGYDYLGLNEVDSQDLSAFQAAKASGSNDRNAYNMAPYQPIYYAGYVQDKIEYRDLVLNLGLRVDVFDNNTQVLRDPFALVPIVRANTVADRPANIGSDYAVYFASGDVVGYRSPSGDFFDTRGNPASGGDITTTLSGQPQATGENKLDPSAFRDYEPEVTLQPRIGVSFPVTDQALFFASYGVLTQRPVERAYDTVQQYSQNLEEYKVLNNTNQFPLKTTQYELGFKQRLGLRAAVTLKGYFKQIEGLTSQREVAFSFPNAYRGYRNLDFGTIKGAEFEFELRRTNNVSVNANYTLSFAQGTGSSSGTLGRINWTNEYVPDFIYPLDFDQRHRLNLVLDYRLGESEGPMVFGAHPFANFGVNVTAQAASGKPYTAVIDPGPFWDSAAASKPAGDINGLSMPWSSLVNLRLDRRFTLGSGSSLVAYLWVTNLFDSQNVLTVNRATGLANEDGFLATPAGRATVASARVPASFRDQYGLYTNRPWYYGLPRQTRLGVRLNF